VADGFDLEALEVGAAEEDAGAAGGGEKAQANRGATVQADAAAVDG